jgi:predicted deacylase
MKIKNNDIKITDLGLLPISIPIRTIGKGNIKISIVAGIHGEESSSLLIIDRIIEAINIKNIGVEINFILAANLLSQALRTRENPVDKLDLNRVFPGDDNCEVTKKA